MTDFDPLHDKAYAQRLTQLGEKREIVASEDIFNEQGILLIKKGSPINERMADKIIRFKLIKPIEASVDINNSLNATDLHRDLMEILDRHPQIKLVHQRIEVDSSIRQLCASFAKFSILKQKLTVLKEQMGHLYRQSLSIAWLSVVIAQNMKLTPQQVETCFLAALAHDIGMMHIDPAVVNKQEALNPAEWRQIQAHTVIAQKVLESISGLDPRVALAVSEHHERCDGSGYPAGKFASQLGVEGQVIALSDSVITVFIKRLLPNGRNLRDLMPLLQVNSESHFYDTYKALILILRNAELDESPFTSNESLDAQVDKLTRDNDRLSLLLNSLEQVVGLFKEGANHKLLASAKTVLIQVMRIVRGSGILDSGYLRWLQQVRKERLSFAYREIDDVSLMLDEIEWHLGRVKKMLDAFIEQGPSSEAKLKELIRAELKKANLQAAAVRDEFAIT
ncbi:MAG TPA: HD domain-containing phosphohydrolase [Dongiaceae bacterium]|nr:HD domain-containing phosphohydrolase [Dongiaceae bacterium]